MKLLVLSDSHGTLDKMERALALESPDVVIHLGDYYRDAEALRKKCGCPVVNVHGNCDMVRNAPAFHMETYEGYRFFMTHGHHYNVKSGLLSLFLAAREQQADMILFGHTHIPYCDMEDGIWILNPGSCKGFPPATYGIIIIDDNGLHCRIKQI